MDIEQRSVADIREDFGASTAAVYLASHRVAKKEILRLREKKPDF